MVSRGLFIHEKSVLFYILAYKQTKSNHQNKIHYPECEMFAIWRYAIHLLFWLKYTWSKKIQANSDKIAMDVREIRWVSFIDQSQYFIHYVFHLIRSICI